MTPTFSDDFNRTSDGTFFIWSDACGAAGSWRTEGKPAAWVRMKPARDGTSAALRFDRDKFTIVRFGPAPGEISETVLVMKGSVGVGDTVRFDSRRERPGVIRYTITVNDDEWASVYYPDHPRSTFTRQSWLRRLWGMVIRCSGRIVPFAGSLVP